MNYIGPDDRQTFNRQMAVFVKSPDRLMKMTKKKTNRYAQLSRNLLQEALLSLLREKRYPKITVTDIVKRAELSRPTFYAHFETKDDLLMSYVDDLLDEINDIIMEKLANGDPADIVQRPIIDGKLFTIWLERKEIFEQIRAANIDYIIFKKIREQHFQIFSQSHLVSPIEKMNPVLQAYCLNYMAGSVAMFLLHWLDEGMPHDPKELGKLLNALNQRNMLLIVNTFNDVIV